MLQTHYLNSLSTFAEQIEIMVFLLSQFYCPVIMLMYSHVKYNIHYKVGPKYNSSKYDNVTI